MQFSSLGLSKSLLDAVASEGYDTPTPIQSQSIPAILAGRDLMGCAQTGTGKTAAFALPILQLLTADGRGRRGRRQPRALILSPTRELAGQIEESMRTYGRRTDLRHVVIYGGVKQFRQVRQLEAGVDVIVATPGRLMDLMEQGFVDLSAVEVFVLDEADRMLDMGFIQPIRKIAEAIPEGRQTLLFSATIPANIVKLAGSLLRDPVRVSVTPDAAAAPSIEQVLYMTSGAKKPALLAHLLGAGGVERAVVFTRTKHGAENLAKKLARDGVMAVAIHGNKSQSQRQRALDGFRAGRSRVLVATDVAARGLDVDGITHVFNFNLPNEPEAYVHRIGRTGRAGATGVAVSLCSPEERQFLRAIERLTGTRMDAATPPAGLNGHESEKDPVGAPEREWAPRAGAGGGQGSSRPRRSRGRQGAGAAPIVTSGAKSDRRPVVVGRSAAAGTASGAGGARPKKPGGRPHAGVVRRSRAG